MLNFTEPTKKSWLTKIENNIAVAAASTRRRQRQCGDAAAGTLPCVEPMRTINKQQRISDAAEGKLPCVEPMMTINEAAAE